MPRTVAAIDSTGGGGTKKLVMICAKRIHSDEIRTGDQPVQLMSLSIL